MVVFDLRLRDGANVRTGGWVLDRGLRTLPHTNRTPLLVA